MLTKSDEADEVAPFNIQIWERAVLNRYLWVGVTTYKADLVAASTNV
jgi:hypothetical protein